MESDKALLSSVLCHTDESPLTSSRVPRCAWEKDSWNQSLALFRPSICQMKLLTSLPDKQIWWNTKVRQGEWYCSMHRSNAANASQQLIQEMYLHWSLRTVLWNQCQLCYQRHMDKCCCLCMHGQHWVPLGRVQGRWGVECCCHRNDTCCDWRAYSALSLNRMINTEWRIWGGISLYIQALLCDSIRACCIAIVWTPLWGPLLLMSFHRVFRFLAFCWGNFADGAFIACQRVFYCSGERCFHFW